MPRELRDARRTGTPSGRYRDHPGRIALKRKEIAMNTKQLLVAVPVTQLILGSATAFAGKTVEEAGVLTCVTDKWDEKELEKGHKLVEMAARCIGVPDDAAALKYTEYCVGKYEFMPDETWKASGTCTYTFKDGDKMYDTFEEGSHLKESTYTITGGTGKHQGAGGGGTYVCETLTDTLCGGRYKGKILLP
jgi:hypothetical protein